MAEISPNNCKFSIILPIYNVEKYLRPCVDSILNQTYGNYEIILVDDGSKDSSPAICDEYASRYECISVIHKPNGGLADARNAGLEVAGGEYVCYIDSDDYLIDNDVLRKLADKTSGCPDIVHYKNVEWFESDGHTADCKYSYDVQTEGRSIVEIYSDLIDRDAYYNSAWSKIVKRSLLVDNGIRFEKGILGEDNEWYYHVVSVAKSLVLIDEPLYVYRRRKGSITTSLTVKNLKDQLYVIGKWVSELRANPQNPAARIIYGSLAKQYCSALIIYSCISDADEYMPALKKLSFLLGYSKNKRVTVFRRMVAVFGVKGTAALLKTYKKIKG